MLWNYAANLLENTMPKYDLQSNFIEITLQHGCSPVNLLHIFRILLPKSTSGGLLLKVKGKQIISSKVQKKENLVRTRQKQQQKIKKKYYTRQIKGNNTFHGCIRQLHSWFHKDCIKNCHEDKLIQIYYLNHLSKSLHVLYSDAKKILLPK